MDWLPNGEKTLICLAISTEYRHLTDGQTDILPWHSLHYAYASCNKNCVQISVGRIVLPNLSQLLATSLLSELQWLPVNSRVTFQLACLTYKLFSISQPAYLHTLLHHYTSIHILCLTNQFFLDVLQFSTKFSHLAPRSGMDYLLLSDLYLQTLS